MNFIVMLTLLVTGLVIGLYMGWSVKGQQKTKYSNADKLKAIEKIENDMDTHVYKDKLMLFGIESESTSDTQLCSDLMTYLDLKGNYFDGVPIKAVELELTLEGYRFWLHPHQETKVDKEA